MEEPGAGRSDSLARAQTSDGSTAAARLDTRSPVFQAALEKVAALIQTQEDLSNLAEKRKWQLARKTNVDTRLRTAIKSQLDGVKTGLQQLEAAVADVQKIKTHMGAVDAAYKTINSVNAIHPSLREQASEYTQLLAAVHNVKDIIRVPETVATVAKLIQEGKYLIAHSYLAGLENCRDDLLVEIARQRGAPNSAEYERNVQVICKYFRQLAGLFEQLEEKLLHQTLPDFIDVASRNPAELTTIVRIIEREEKKNDLCREMLVKEKMEHPERPGRREWRELCLDKLTESLKIKVSGYFVQLMEFLQQSDFTHNHTVFGNQIHMIRLQVLQVLTVLKTHISRCFPPHFASRRGCANIYDFFVDVIHGKMAEMTLNVCIEVTAPQVSLDRRMAQKPLIQQMIFFVVYQYTGSSLFGDPELEIDVSKLEPVVPEATIRDMETLLQELSREQLQELSHKLLAIEEDGWREVKLDNKQEVVLPKVVQGLMNGTIHLDVYSLFNNHFKSATQGVTRHITFNIGQICLEGYSDFADNFKQAIVRYSNEFDKFAGPNEEAKYVATLVSHVNCCQNLTSNVSKLGDHYKEACATDDETRASIDHSVKQVRIKYLQLAVFIADTLLFNFINHYLEPYMEKVMTREHWLVGEEADSLFETFSVTLEEFLAHELSHMTSAYVIAFLKKCEAEIAVAYVRKLITKKLIGGSSISAQTADDRKKIAYKLKREGDILEKFFYKKQKEILSQEIARDSPLLALTRLGDIYQADSAMIGLELGTFRVAFPDVTHTQLERLLNFREDYRGEAGRSVVRTAMERKLEHVKTTIFSLPALSTN